MLLTYSVMVPTVKGGWMKFIKRYKEKLQEQAEFFQFLGLACPVDAPTMGTVPTTHKMPMNSIPTCFLVGNTKLISDQIWLLSHSASAEEVLERLIWAYRMFAAARITN